MNGTLRIFSFSSMLLTFRLKRSVPEPAEECEIHSMGFEGYACACAALVPRVKIARKHGTDERTERRNALLIMVSSFCMGLSTQCCDCSHTLHRSARLRQHSNSTSVG